MTAFAEARDLESRWKGYDPKDEDLANQLLADASVWIRAWIPAAAALAEVPEVADALTMVSCAMAKRSLLNGESEGQSWNGETVGPFGMQIGFKNPEGNLYMTSAEKQLLEGLCGGNTAGAVSMTSWGL